MSEIPSAPPQELHPEEMTDLDRLRAMFEDDFAAVEGVPADSSRVAETTVGGVQSEGVSATAEPSAKPSEDAPRSLHDLIRPAPSMQTTLSPSVPEVSPVVESQTEVAEPPRHDAVDIPVAATKVPVTSPEIETPSAPVIVEPREVNYDEPLRLAFVSQEHDADVQTRHEAKQRQHEWAQEGGKVKRFVKGIWNSYLGEIHGLKYRREARDEIRQNGNVFIDQTKEEAQRSLQATINRHTSNYEEMIHRERGERREDLAEDSELSVTIKDFIRKNIDGELSDEALREEAVRAVNAYGEKLDRNAFNQNAMIADNLLSIRDAVVGAREHEGGIERVLEDLKISVGESRTGANTEARYNWAEKVADKISSTRVGAIASPEAVLVAATVAGSVLRLGGTRAAASALTFVPGVAGAGLAALRESRTTEDERVQTARDMTLGRHAEAGSKRREQLEKTVYTMAAASDMTAELYASIAEDVDLDDHENLRNAFNSIVNTRARIKTSEVKGIDLISYSEGKMEEEREALDLARAYAKAAVRSKMDNQDTLRALGMPVGMEFDALIDRQANLSTEFDKDIDAKDRAFKKLKHRRVATAAAVGAVTGLVLGVAAQEAVAAIDPTRAGLIEQLWHAKTELYNGQEHHTLLDGLTQGQSSHEISVHHAASSAFEASSFGSDDTQYNVSADHTLVHNDNGTVDLLSHGDDKSVSGLETNSDGTMTQSALDKLHDAGFKVTDHTEHLTRDVTHTENSSVHQFIEHHNSDFTHASTDLWYDNNTPAPDFDQNELKLQWSGNEGLDGHGGYKMTIANMTENGSFHDAKEAKLHELIASGKMKLALSADANTQHQVIMVDVNKDGTVEMPEGSTAASLFSTENGHAEFNGGYAQAVQLEGKGSDGVQHMASLATLVGNNSLHEIHDTFTTRETYLHHDYTIKSDGFTTHERVGDYTEMAPVLPVVPRRGIESVERRSAPEALNPKRYYRGEMTSEQLRAMTLETSPRLLNDANAELNPYEELGWYKELVRKNKNRGPAYVAEVEAKIAASPELSDLPQNLKAIVKIPVNAAGDYESENIYKVLENGYAKQDQDALDSSLILLHVNWVNDVAASDEGSAKIARTKSEIERFKREHPNIKVATIESEWQRQDIQGGVMGHVVRNLNDAALFALGDAMEKGKIEKDRDVLLIRNDADLKGISTHYLKRFIDAAAEDKEPDVFTGTTTFDSTKAVQQPGFVFAANFMQSIGILSTGREHRAHTAGANFAVRAATLAAVGACGFDEYTGVASDDVEIGVRVTGARSGAVGRAAKSGNAYSMVRAASAAATRRVGKRVGGARIDTDSDREEIRYQRGVPMVNTWINGFDDNGYVDRNTGLQESPKEKLGNDNDAIIERIRNDMEGTINIEQSRGVVDTALAFAFAGAPSKAYTLTGKIGDYRLNLTDAGKEYLVRYLTRDSHGRFDPYGRRKLRQMYGEVKTGAKRQPTSQSMYRV